MKPTEPKKNPHVDRLKRGLYALGELVTIALAAGAAIGGVVGGFVSAYSLIGWPIVLIVLAVVFLIYVLGIADQRDDKPASPSTTNQKDKP